MAKNTGIAPWLNLVAGLGWMLVALLNSGVPAFLGIAHRSNPHSAILAPLSATSGVLLLIAAVHRFIANRRNPDGKIPPAITTLFGPQ